MANKIYVLVYKMAPNCLPYFSEGKKFINTFNTILYLLLILFIVKKSEKCEKKLNPLTGAAKTQRYIKKKLKKFLTPLRTTFRTGVSLRRFLPPFIDKKRNKTAEIQRHVKNNLSSPVRLFFFACVSLRYVYLYFCSTKTKRKALGAQWIHMSLREMGHLKLNIYYVIASVGPSWLFINHPHTSIYIVAKVQGEVLGGCPTMPGEHKVHPYLHLETLCRGESCVRLYTGFQCFLLF